MAIKFRKPTWFLTLFSLPFFGVGIGFLFFSIIPTLYLGLTAPNWDKVNATLTSARLEVSHGDSTTYQATASYRYKYQDEIFHSDNVGFSKSNDNVGDWQYSTGRRLERIYNDEKIITAFVNPNSPDVSYLYPEIRWGMIGFKMIFVVVFGGIGGGMFFGSFITLPNPVGRLKENRALARQRAQSDHIYSTARKVFWGLLGIAVFVGAMSSPILFNFSDEWRSGNKAILVALLFPIISLGLFIAALREGLRLLKFGRSPLIMSPYPAGIGGHFGATVQINIPYHSQQRFNVTLSLINTYTSRSGNKSQTHHRTLWHQEGIAYVEYGVNNKTKLRFAFNIPNGMSETSEPSKNYYHWQCDVEADIPRTNFKRSFEVPVLNVKKPVKTQQYLAVDHPAMSKLVDDRISKLHINDRDSEIETWIPRFSYAYNRIGGVFFGGIFVGAGIGVSIGGAPFIFPLLFVPVGSIIMLVCIRNYLTATRTLISNEGIQQYNSFIGIFKKEKKILTNEFGKFSIKDASTWQSSSGTKSYYFAIQANPNNGKSIVVVDKVEGKETAEALVEKFEKLIYN